MAALARLAGASFVNGALEARGLAVVTFLYLYDAIRHIGGVPRSPGLRAEVTSTLPIGAGLGSSAAFCVSLASALLCGFGLVDAGRGGWGGGRSRSGLIYSNLARLRCRLDD